MADNLELLNAVALVLDRTHVLRVVDLEDVGNLRVIATDMREFRDALASGDAVRAAANLEQQTSKKFERLPDLVRRANTRVATAADKSCDLAAQTTQAFAKIDTVLGRLGSDRSHLLSVTVYLARI